jgi:hypothetical protein
MNILHFLRLMSHVIATLFDNGYALRPVPAYLRIRRKGSGPFTRDRDQP